MFEFEQNKRVFLEKLLHQLFFVKLMQKVQEFALLIDVGHISESYDHCYTFETIAFSLAGAGANADSE